MHAFPCFPASQTVLFFLENYFKDKNLYPGFGDLVFVVLLFCFFFLLLLIACSQVFPFLLLLTLLSLANIKLFYFSLPLSFFRMPLLSM